MMAAIALQQTGRRYTRNCSYRPLGRKPIDGRFSVVSEPDSRSTFGSKDSVNIDPQNRPAFNSHMLNGTHGKAGSRIASSWSFSCPIKTQ